MAAVALAQTTYCSYCDPLTCQQVEAVRRHQTKAAATTTADSSSSSSWQTLLKEERRGDEYEDGVR